ncbi:MAG: type II toxin-antitoxin system Phd/YefM family antitoxin [Limisphaerales bacterium]
MNTTLSIKEAQGRLSELLELAQSGHEVIIEDSHKGKARLVPVAEMKKQKPRVFDLHKGQVWMSDDFNAPLPDSFWTGETE